MTEKTQNAALRQHLIFDPEISCLRGITVDNFICRPTFKLVTGWKLNIEIVCFKSQSGDSLQSDVHYFGREDVALGYGVDLHHAQGFIAFVHCKQIDSIVCSSKNDSASVQDIVLNGQQDQSLDQVSQVLEENKPRLGLFFSHFLTDPNCMGALAKVLLKCELTSESPHVGGHIESARGVSGVGGLVIGWAVCQPSFDLWLIDEDGFTTSLSEAARWDRGDIVSAFSSKFGRLVRNSGFIQKCDCVTAGKRFVLLALHEETIEIMSESRWKVVSDDPVAFARWAFELQSSGRTQIDRLLKHDGIIIQRLILRASEKTALYPAVVKKELFGTPPENPIVTIAIPLYGRFDFMINQMLEFSGDDYLRDRCKIIYFIDDPGIIDDVIGMSRILYSMYSFSFQLCWTEMNHGFAAASNIAAREGDSPYILMLNSDVIPTEPAWLKTMVQNLVENPKYGILGACLHYPGGGIQHNGMTCQWEPNWAAYLNKHPGMGYHNETLKSGTLIDVFLVTAACLLVERKLFEQVGGFDETFLIGDFEDSDFCLRVRQKGFEIGCFQTRALVHLERQSFGGIGQNYFRESVAKYNAIIHQRRWGELIERELKLFDKSSQGI